MYSTVIPSYPIAPRPDFHLEASDENFPYGTIVIGEEKTIIYSFLNIPMKEESIVFNEDGSFDTESINYPIYTMAPFVISLVLTTVIFLIISLIRSRKNPHKHKKREQFLFEWTFKD